MIRRSLGFVAACCAAQLFATAPAFAHGEGAPAADTGPASSTGGELTVGGTTSGPQSDTGVKAKGEEKKEKKPEKLPWHGSIFFVDQSFTTQTIGLGSDYQSRNPTYEMWYSFRPRYYFYESDLESFNVNGRFDVFHELTNSDSTTQNHEAVFGDSWFNGVYQRTLYNDDETGVQTKLSLGPRAILGTSKTSSGRGLIAQVGGFVGMTQQLPLAGPKETFFPTTSLRASAAYTKHINRCTTACNPNFEYTREDSGGRSLVSNQVSGAAMVNHQVVADVGFDLPFIDKVKLGVDYLWILQWTYPVSDQNGTVNTATSGPVSPTLEQNPQTFRVSPWFLASVDYDVIDEMTLSLGYYNYTNQIGPDGQRRNPLWSPDARFFFTVTANLDAIYETASGRREEVKAQDPSRTSSNGPAAHF